MNWKARSVLIAESMYEFSAGLLGPIYAVFVENIGGDLLTAGWAWSVFAIASGIGLYVMGRLEDRIRRDNWVVAIGFGMSSLALLSYIFVSKPWHLFVVQIVIGLSWALGTPTIDAIYSRNVDHKKLNSQWGIWEASMKIIEGVSAFFGAIIAFKYGFKTLFIIMFIISLIGTVIVSRLVWKKDLKSVAMHR